MTNAATLHFDLPPLDGATGAAFASTAECKRWLSTQTLTNAGSLQRELCEQITLLNRQPIALRQRFDILEMLHPHIAFAQEEVSKRYAGRALPHLAAEAEAFAAVIELWTVVGVGYLRCLEDAHTGAASARTLATLVQCALATLHMMQIDRARSFMQPDAQHWSRFHRLLAFAEDRDILTTPTIDEARYGERAVTPLSVYAEAMLLHAANATEFSLRPLNWTIRWARLWSGKLVLRREPPADLRAIPINIDLDSSLAPNPLPIKSASRARFLDTGELAVVINACLAGLAEGKAPAQLQLGEDCIQPGCQLMLQRLYQRWCKGGMQRPADRFATTGAVELASGAENIWFHVAGSAFKQPRPSDEMLRREREEIATFGHVSGRAETQMLDMSKLHTKTDWQIVNEGPSGMRLMRAMHADSMRIGIGQLIAVKKPAGESFMPATVRWLLLDHENCLHAGIHLLAKKMTPISFRNAGLNTAKDSWRPAFVVDGEQTATQLLLPVGTFRNDRVIDVDGGAVRQYKLARLLDRGEDFERVEAA